MPSKKTEGDDNRCVLTLPLITEKYQEDILEKRFKIMEHLINSLIAMELRKLKNLQRRKDYKDLEQSKAITRRQFDWLMSGLEIEQPKAIRRR